jgi:acyl dehydratase
MGSDGENTPDAAGITGRHFEEFELGDRFLTPARTVTEADIVLFAGLSGDYAAMHTDEESAKNSPFEGRVAHGTLTFVITTGLMFRMTHLYHETVLALLGIDNVRYTHPVRAGDTLHAVIEIVDKRETSKSERGVIIQRVSTRNAEGVEVATCEFTNLVKRLPNESP